MEFLKEWTLCVCISLVAAVIFSLFTPKGNMKRFYKILISLFVFISFLYPLHGFRLSSLDLESLIPEITAEEQQNRVYEDTVNSQVLHILEEESVTGAAVSSKVSLNYETGEITLEEVQVAVSDEYDKDEVRKMLFDTLGINARVIDIGA